jgi:hypothetical protein
MQSLPRHACESNRKRAISVRRMLCRGDPQLHDEGNLEVDCHVSLLLRILLQRHPSSSVMNNKTVGRNQP